MSRRRSASATSRAFGALSECQERKWKVPERIAIAGFGDFEISSCCSHPTITTVGVNCWNIGQRRASCCSAPSRASGRGSRSGLNNHHGLRRDRAG